MSLIAQLLEEKGIILSSKQEQQFQDYYQLLVEWNSKVNLTAITEKEEVAIKHFFDSLTPAFYLHFAGGETLCDVGSGAGFPGIPLKILFPKLKLIIVDSLNKRLLFLEKVKEKLQLEDVFLYHDRAETFAHRQDIRGQLDWVTARAVANLSVLSEYCLPLLRVGGTFIALKGSHANEEIEEASGALRLLGGRLRRQINIDLPEDCGKRSLVLIEKEKATPEKYPRNPGIPAKKPLH